MPDRWRILVLLRIVVLIGVFGILRRAMELEVEGRRTVGRPKKSWSKIMEDGMRTLNITEDMEEDRKH